MKRSCGRGQRVEEDREEMGQKYRKKRQLEEGEERKSLLKGQMAEDASLLNWIPSATDEIYYTLIYSSANWSTSMSF